VFIIWIINFTDSVYVSDKGQVFTWGYGMLGQGPNVESSTCPLLLPSTLFGASEFNPEVKVKHISSGLYHFAALNGTV